MLTPISLGLIGFKNTCENLQLPSALQYLVKYLGITGICNSRTRWMVQILVAPRYR